MMNSKVTSGDREIASIFKQSQSQSVVTHEWELNNEGQWIIKPFAGNLSTVVVHGKDIECNEENIVKVNAADKIIYYLTKNSLVNCKSATPKKVKVDYNFYDFSLSDVSSTQLSLIGDVLKNIDKNKLENVVDKVKLLGIDDLYEKELTLAELNELPIKEGDHVELEIWPQLQTVNCPNGKCHLQVNVFGLLDFEKLGQLNGMNQLKYQELSPFLFFCGSRYTAGNIYFRADERMEFRHTVDENGFSCDINSFLLKSDVVEYKFKLKWISKDNLQQILMGKLDDFIKQKNNSQKNKIIQYIQQIEALNSVQLNDPSRQTEAIKVNGHIELWWEPFDKCEKEKLECFEKEMIMTRSRLIHNGESNQMSKDIHLVHLGLKQVVQAEDAPVAFVVKLCPEDLDKFVLDQMEFSKQSIDETTFKSKIQDYQKSSCNIVDTTDTGKKFDYRWLLATVPKEIEKEEVDLLIEDYQVLETPSENRLKKDPFQKGKIFFDVYMKNLKNREVLFKRSRIIEVIK